MHNVRLLLPAEFPGDDPAQYRRPKISKKEERVLNFTTYHNKLEQLNRRIALRVVSGYRTAQTVAVLAITKIPPIALKIKERKNLYEKNSRRTERCPAARESSGTNQTDGRRVD
ncbi:hypothetical protein ABEB36_000017 [Hypothenemus hampei]|uniref:Uncharacterized protein n=1 Tax=Hypothenemus hampei TaxID=57062 RepID=A0ABD1FDL9_HYPHA